MEEVKEHKIHIFNKQSCDSKTQREEPESHEGDESDVSRSSDLFTDVSSLWRR